MDVFSHESVKSLFSLSEFVVCVTVVMLTIILVTDWMRAQKQKLNWGILTPVYEVYCG